jgi:hypothetical protein
LKQDGLGRVRTRADRREQLLAEFERSGLSGAKFAALTGVKYSTFAAWCQRRRKPAGSAVPVPAPPADPVRWLEALVEPTASAGDGRVPVLVLQLPGGVRLEMTQAKQATLIARLIRALEQPC